MRTLKRNLAFVLALVMALSLTVSAANVVEYTDHDDIAFVEAVEVLSAMGILEGTDGVFNPTKVLNRAEAAKIVAYMMLGEKTASNLKAVEAPFADVPAAHWAAGYISYCVDAGIVKGMTAETYAPTAELTATQFAAMLLRACGYGVNGEYEGKGWDVKVNTDALTKGIYEGNLGVNFAAGCTREEAALYAFNTLMNVDTVEFVKLFEIYTETDATLADLLYPTFEEKTGVTDAFGRVGNVWVDNSIKGDDKVVTNMLDSEAVLTYKTAVKVTTLYKELGLKKTATPVSVLRNNEADTVKDIVKEDSTAVYGGKGVMTEVYVDKNDNISIVMVDTYIGKVGEWNEKNENAEVVIEGVGKLTTDVKFDKNAVVLVTVADDKIQSIELADSFEAEVTKETASAIYLDGEKNEFGANAKEVEWAYETAYTVYVDNYGYIMDMVKVEEAATESIVDGYVKVLDTQGKLATSDLLTSTDDVAKVKVNFLDGTKAQVLDLATKYVKDGDKEVFSLITVEKDDKKLVEKTAPVAIADNGDVEGIEVNGFYGYYMIDDAIVLVDLDLLDNAELLDVDTLTFAKNRVVNGMVLNSKTELVVVNGTKVETTVGYKNMNATVNGEILVITEKGVVATIIVLGETEAAAAEDVIAYYTGNWSKDAKNTYVELVIDGDVDTYTFTGTLPEAKGMFVVESNTDGKVTKLTEAEVVEGKVVAVNDNYLQVVEGESIYFAEDVAVYTLEGNTTTVAKEDNVYVILDKDGFIATVYVK